MSGIGQMLWIKPSGSSPPGTFLSLPGGSNTSGAISYDNGVTFTPITLPTLPGGYTWNSGVWNGSVFCILALDGSSPPNFFTAISSDGVSWTTGSIYACPTAPNYPLLLWSGSFFLIDSVSITSIDGLHWS